MDRCNSSTKFHITESCICFVKTILNLKIIIIHWIRNLGWGQHTFNIFISTTSYDLDFDKRKISHRAFTQWYSNNINSYYYYIIAKKKWKLNVQIMIQFPKEKNSNKSYQPAARKSVHCVQQKVWSNKKSFHKSKQEFKGFLHNDEGKKFAVSLYITFLLLLMQEPMM